MLTQGKTGFLKLLSEGELRKIHYSTLQVLENTGVRFTLPEAQEVFRATGLTVDKSGVVYFPPYIVEDAIKKTPSTFTRYPLHSSYEKIVMGSDKLYLGPGSSPLWILDIDGKRRPACIEDIADYARLGDGLANLPLGNGGFNVELLPEDTPKKTFHAIHFETLVNSTCKPAPTADLLNTKIAKDIIELASIVLGGKKEIGKKKTFHATACPEGPLRWGNNVVTFIEGAKVRMPLGIMPMPFAGSGAPVTIAGTLVQLNAEILSVLVLIQLISPGAPVVYAPYPGIMDMRAANHSMGCPEAALISGAVAQLSRWYEIPNDTIVGTTDSKLPDAQAAYEKMMTALLPALAGANSITLFGGMIDLSSTMSLEQLVIDDEIAGNICRILERIDITENKLAVDVINDIAHKESNFLDHPHTLKYFKDEFYFPSLGDRNPRGTWKKEGSKDIRERAREKAKKVLSEHFPPSLDKEVQEELGKAVKKICEREREPYRSCRN